MQFQPHPTCFTNGWSKEYYGPEAAHLCPFDLFSNGGNICLCSSWLKNREQLEYMVKKEPSFIYYVFINFENWDSTSYLQFGSV